MQTTAPISAAELGTLWVTYQEKKMMSRMMEYFIENTNDPTAKDILTTYNNEDNQFTAEIEGILNKEGAVIPVSFSDSDVRKDAPPLYDEMFAPLFLRFVMKFSAGLNAMHLDMSYRKDIRDFFIRSTANSQVTYDKCTDYLLDHGVLSRPPYVTMPKEVEFVEDTKYMAGFRMLGNKRAINTVELAYIYQNIESNVTGMQLLTGFAQVAKEKEVRDHMVKGKELAKKIVASLSSVLLQSDIQPPSTWAGRATSSSEPPFSDKLMMFCTTMLSSFALGSSALSTSMSLRSDLPAKIVKIGLDTFEYASEGAKIMIRHRWLEEPPQMEDRNQLIKSK